MSGFRNLSWAVLLLIFALLTKSVKVDDYPSITDDDSEPRTMPIGWENCGKPGDLVSLNSISITPDPPKRARKMKVRVIGDLAQTLTTGRVNFTVHYGIIPIVQDSMELCEALKMEPGIPQCPLRKGHWDVTHEVDIPTEVPFGRYTIKATGWTENGDPIFCVRGTTTISLLSSAAGLEESDDPQGEDPGEYYGDRQVNF